MRGGWAWIRDEFIFEHVEFEDTHITTRKRYLMLGNAEINEKGMELEQKTWDKSHRVALSGAGVSRSHLPCHFPRLTAWGVSEKE